MTEKLLNDIARIELLGGWCSQEKAKAMAGLILEVNPKLCVELGVFAGRSLVAQGLALKERSLGGSGGVIWGIDPWTIDAALEGNIGDANVEWWRSIPIHVIRNQAFDAIGDFGLWGQVRVIVGKAEDSAFLFKDIDILHIDGNHSEEKSTNDVEMWAGRVKSGGYIWFDDVDWKTTEKAVTLLKTNYADHVRDVVSHGAGMCSLFRKR